MSAQTIPNYPWKLFQITAQNCLGKMFALRWSLADIAVTLPNHGPVIAQI